MVYFLKLSLFTCFHNLEQVHRDLLRYQPKLNAFTSTLTDAAPQLNYTQITITTATQMNQNHSYFIILNHQVMAMRFVTFVTIQGVTQFLY